MISEHPQLRDLRTVAIDRTTFERLRVAGPAGQGLAGAVRLHRGALGIPWLDSGAVEVVDGPAGEAAGRRNLGPREP